MLPPSPIIRASVRWLSALQFHTVKQSWRIIGADNRFLDLSRTQYSEALDWLTELGFLDEQSNYENLRQNFISLPPNVLAEILLERTLQHSNLAWMRDADVLIPDKTELPLDVISLSDTLEIDQSKAFQSVQRAFGKIDLERRNSIGSAGELELMRILDALPNGAAVHVASASDSFGYDISFKCRDVEYHIEVKSTTRRGRLAIHLSRHESEIGAQDPNWRLVIVGLNDAMKIQAVATVRHPKILNRSPKDTAASSKWQSASHELAPDDIEPGLPFLRDSVQFKPNMPEKIVFSGGDDTGRFAWLDANLL